MLKRTLLLLFLLSCLSQLPMAQQYRFGLVSDPDGWTNVREAPNLNAKVVERVDSGDRVIVVQEKGDFYDCLLLFQKNDLPDIFGYIHKSRVKYVKPALGAGIVNDPDGWSNLRSGASSASSVVTRVKPEDGFFVVLQKSGEWYKIKTRAGESGYLHGSRLEWVIPRN